MSAQPCGCDPKCRTRDHEQIVVTASGYVVALTLKFYTCESFPDCPFGEAFCWSLEMEEEA